MRLRPALKFCRQTCGKSARFCPSTALTPPWPTRRISPRAAGKQPLLAAAWSEATCTLAQLLDAAAWLVKTGGRLALVYRPERLCDLLCGLRQAGFEPKRMRLVRHHAGAPVSLLLVESRRGGKPGLALEPDLLLFTPDGAPTAEYRQLYYLDKE